MAVLVDPAYATMTEATLRDVEAAARASGLQIRVLTADTSRAIDTAFEIIGRERPDALFVGPGPFFNSRRVQFAQLAARYAVPTTHPTRPEAEAGGLDPVLPTPIVRSASTLAASSRATSPRTCRSCSRASSSW